MLQGKSKSNKGFNLTHLCDESYFSSIRRARFKPFNGSQVKPMLGAQTKAVREKKYG